MVNTLIDNGLGQTSCSIYNPDLYGAYKSFLAPANESPDLLMSEPNADTVRHSTAFGKIWHSTFESVLSHKLLHGHKVHTFIPEDAKRVLLLDHRMYDPVARLSLPLKLK